MAAPEISVIIASDRTGPDLDRCLASLARQEEAPPFEVLVVSAEEPPRRDDLLVGWVRMEERNPGARRNRGADFAAGRLLAFIDDDACATPGWLRRGSEVAARTPLFGGIDLVPEGSPYGERLADLLVATPRIGSAVPAHERSPRPGPIRLPSDLALCNLFVDRELRDRLDGFDETLGYIGEDTDFVHRAMKAGVVPELDPDLVVHHRRRAFPAAFLAQRWRYRVKSGRRLVERPDGAPVALIAGFLAAAAAATAGTIVFGRRFAIPAAAAYAAATWAFSAPVWRRDPALFPAVPAAFFLHHANYAIATVAGIGAALAGRSGASREAAPDPGAAPGAR
ncbi:MAG TPA: glycosyltransferase [Thermoanaerobaculia bacterium]|nr:glycosyltransferase [Thermoanaerobaculia bacterium]